MLDVVDLFCGGGGSTCGVDVTGLAKVRLGIDFDAKTLTAYSANHSHSVECMDLSEEDVTTIAERIGSPDVIIGSPPCQDFSLAGKRIEGERAALTAKFAEIVSLVRPAGFIMENVPQVLSSAAFEQATSIWKIAGYHVGAAVITASNVGVPQRRKRAIVVGTLGGLDAIRAFLDKSISLSFQPHAVLGDVLSQELRVSHRYLSDATHIDLDMRVPTLRTNCSAFVRTMDGQMLDKTLLGQLSGFPSGYKWPDSRTLTGRIIGNAVPPPVMEWTVRAAHACFDGSIPRPHDEEPGQFHAPCTYSGRRQPKEPKEPRAPNGLFLLGLTMVEGTPSPEEIREAAEAECMYARTTPTLHVRYTIGAGSADADQRANILTRFQMQPGWTIEIRQRGRSIGPSDDTYWYVPMNGHVSRFRSRPEMERAGLVGVC